MPKLIRLAQGARRKPVNFLRLFVFFNLAQFWDILALFHKVMVSEVCMYPVSSRVVMQLAMRS